MVPLSMRGRPGPTLNRLLHKEFCRIHPHSHQDPSLARGGSAFQTIVQNADDGAIRLADRSNCPIYRCARYTHDHRNVHARTNAKTGRTHLHTEPHTHRHPNPGRYPHTHGHGHRDLYASANKAR